MRKTCCVKILGWNLFWEGVSFLVPVNL